MIYIYILFTMLFVILSFIIYRDVSAPVFISGVIWLGVYALLSNYGFNVETDPHLWVFFVAYIFFFLGFMVALPKRPKCTYTEEYGVHMNSAAGVSILVLMYVTAAIWTVVFRRDLVVNITSAWLALKNSETSVGAISGILGNAFPVFSAVALYGYLKDDDKKNRNFFLLTLPPTLLALLFANRSTWFYVISTYVYLIIVIKRLNNKKILYISIIAFVFIAFIFVMSSIAKYANVRGNDTIIEQLSSVFNGYFSGPPVAYLNWLQRPHEYTHGTHTFRFFLALSRLIDSSIVVPDTVMPYISIGKGITNVYTVLHWYTMDFGIWWAVLFQGLIGFGFGRLYKGVKIRSNPPKYLVIIYSMFISIVLSQFFCDTLMTHLSSWIQRIFWAWLISRVLIIENNAYTVKNKKRRIKIVWHH